MKQQFVKTSDDRVASELRQSGYTELNREGKYYVFINNGHINFSEDDRKKVVYTDKFFV